MTIHADTQAQRRCINSLIVDYLIEFGKRVHCGSGCTRYFFDKAARRYVRASTERSVYAQLEKKMNSFLVVNENSHDVVTVGHQYKKIRN